MNAVVKRLDKNPTTRGTPLAAKAKETAPELPAVPYEPTELEAQVIAKYTNRSRSRQKPPRMNVTMSEHNGVKTANTSVEHPDQIAGHMILASAIAVDDAGFLMGQIGSLANAANNLGVLDANLLNYGISIVAGIEPKDFVEALLASQMAAVQIATMNIAGRLGNASSPESRGASEKAFNRLARTFTAQVEALKRYRSKGEQRVYVERVNVESGAQAIVGPVNQKGEG